MLQCCTGLAQFGFPLAPTFFPAGLTFNCLMAHTRTGAAQKPLSLIGKDAGSWFIDRQNAFKTRA